MPLLIVTQSSCGTIPDYYPAYGGGPTDPTKTNFYAGSPWAVGYWEIGRTIGGVTTVVATSGAPNGYNVTGTYDNTDIFFGAHGSLTICVPAGATVTTGSANFYTASRAMYLTTPTASTVQQGQFDVAEAMAPIAAPTGLASAGGSGGVCEGGQATLSHNPVTGATSYRYRMNGVVLSPDISAPTTSRVVTGLSLGSVYVFTVSAINGDGEGPESDPITVVPCQDAPTPGGSCWSSVPVACGPYSAIPVPDTEWAASVIDCDCGED